MAGAAGLWIRRPQSKSSTTSEESRSRRSSNSTSCRRRATSEVALIDEHHGPVGPSFPVDEAGALIQATGGGAILAGAQLHEVRALRPGGLDRRLHERAAQPVPTQVRDDVELLE